MAKKITTIASAAPSGDDAPKKKPVKKTNGGGSINKDLIASFMKHSAAVDKELTSYGSTLESSIYSNISEYIDTGSYAMNRLISGSLFGGIPSGRVIAFAGEPGVGKTFALGQTIRNAQAMGYLVLYYDSENAVDNDFMSNLGVKTDEMLYFPIDTAEDFKNHVVKTVGAFKKENKNAKIFIALDSLGNLSCAQEKGFIEKGTSGTDMGCFVPDTMVLVNGSDIKIQDVKIGDIVITHLNRERPVTNIFKYTDKNEKFKISVNGSVLETTPNHKLLVMCNDAKEIKWKLVNDITKLDKLVKMK